jgi:hypothetical protein
LNVGAITALSNSLDLPRPVGLAESTLLHLFDVDFEIPGTVVEHDPTSPRNRRRPWG